MKLSDTQERLLRRFRRMMRRKQVGYHDVCIHDSSNRGGRFSLSTFEALHKKGLIEPSIAREHDVTWWKITQVGIDHLNS